MLELYCIVISSALKAFVLFSLWNAIIVVAGLIFMTYVLVNTGNDFCNYYLGRRIFNNMYVEKDQAITGKIEKD